MKKTLRIISFILICSLWLSALPVFAAESGDAGREAGILQALDMVSADFQYVPEAQMTRAEYVVQLVEYVDAYGTLENFDNSTYFLDVPVTRQDAKAVALAYKLGLVAMDDARLFRPDEEITMQEACAMLMRGLGYELYSENLGGFPNGYITTANQKKILVNTGFQPEATLNMSQMAQMFYNALEVEMLVKDFSTLLGTDRVSYEEDAERTMLSIRSIRRERGIVRATEKVDLDNNVPLTSGYVRIGEELFQAGNSGGAELLGYMVDFYYKEDQDNDENTILYIEQNKGKNNTWLIKAKDIDYAEKNKYAYWDEENRSRVVNIAQDADVVYNDALLFEVAGEIMTPKKGSVRLIDNNGDNRADIVLIDATTVILVKSIVNEKVMDMYDETLFFDFQAPEIGQYTIEDSSGNILDISDIREWSTLDIRRSTDSETGKANYRIIMNYLMETGTVSDVSYTGSGEDRRKRIKIEVDSRGYYEKQYIVSELMPDSVSDKLKTGITIEFCLDTDGEIIGLKSIGNSARFGYLFKAYQEEDSEALMLKMYTDKGEVETLECNSRSLILDARSLKNYNVGEIIEEINGALINPNDPKENNYHMIRFKTNAKNIVTEIDTLTKSPDEKVTGKDEYNGMRIVQSAYSQRYKSSSMSFSGVYNIDTDTVVFNIPQDDTQLDFFSVTTPSYFKNDTSYKAVAYYVEHDQLRAPMIVMFGSKGGSLGNDEPGIVEQIYPAVNAEDEVGFQIKLRKKSGSVEYFVSSRAEFEAKDIDIGDVVRFSLDLKSEIGYIEKTFDRSEKSLWRDNAKINYKYYGSSANYSYTDSLMFVANTVKRRKDDIVLMDVNPSYASMTDISFILNKATIFRYDEDAKKSKIVEGTLSEIVPEEEYKNQGSYMFVYMSYGEIRWVYVV